MFFFVLLCYYLSSYSSFYKFLIRISFSLAYFLRFTMYYFLCLLSSFSSSRSIRAMSSWLLRLISSYFMFSYYCSTVSWIFLISWDSPYLVIFVLFSSYLNLLVIYVLALTSWSLYSVTLFKKDSIPCIFSYIILIFS